MLSPSPTGGVMPSYDDCYLCNWHMTGAFKRHGNGRSGTEVWCGAGRPEFITGYKCPTRLPIIEMELCETEHPTIIVIVREMNGSAKAELRPEVVEWMTYNTPNSRVEMDWHDCLCLRFDTPEAATLFKMFWL